MRQGDTLYSVAFLYGYSVQEVAAWNRLRTPYTIYKGQQLRIKPPPISSKPKPRSVIHGKQGAAAPPPRPSQPKPSQPKPSQPKASQPKIRTTASPPPVATAARKPQSTARERQLSSAATPGWAWPANGRLIQRYNPKISGSKGIDIAGSRGEAVRAAAPGKVVYAGSGLSGYGRLIIIKHNKDFLSAYAHNQKLIAKEGQWVKKGETIARMGSSGADRTQLHFEIRKHGRPVDPLRYLPRR